MPREHASHRDQQGTQRHHPPMGTHIQQHAPKGRHHPRPGDHEHHRTTKKAE